MDRKELVTFLSTDLSKGFDTLYPALTIKKLKAYGFGNRSLDLMRSFFDRRFNMVKINGHTSQRKTMARGCPQGTTFEPLLWNMFQNDIAYHVNVPTLTKYTDDHQLYAAGETHGTVESRLKTQGHLASSWFKNNFLFVNSEKFQSLIVNPRNIDEENDDKTLNIDNHDIRKTEQIKLPRVYIEEIESQQRVILASYVRELVKGRNTCTSAKLNTL